MAVDLELFYESQQQLNEAVANYISEVAANQFTQQENLNGILRDQVMELTTLTTRYGLIFEALLAIQTGQTKTNLASFFKSMADSENEALAEHGQEILKMLGD